MKKLFIITLFALVIVATVAHAGVFETVKNLVTDPMRVSIYAGLGLVLAYIFKRIPNNKIQKVIGKFFRGLGVAMTLGLSRYPYTAPVYEKYIEKFVIDLIDNIIVCAAREFVVGLRSNNKPEK